VVRAQHLAQKDPKRYERRINSVDPECPNRGQGSRDEVL